MRETIIRSMERYCNNLVRRAAVIDYIGWVEVLVTLHNGDRYIYNDLDHGVRRMPRDPNNMTEDECLREFGWRLYNIMRIKGITQADLADMTGIPQSRISNYVNGRTSPGFYNVDKMAKALGCSVDELRYL